ncbi:hypothetical protein Dimus_005395, partial [Dionaea muscipula]
MVLLPGLLSLHGSAEELHKGQAGRGHGEACLRRRVRGCCSPKKVSLLARGWEKVHTRLRCSPNRCPLLAQGFTAREEGDRVGVDRAAAARHFRIPMAGAAARRLRLLACLLPAMSCCSLMWRFHCSLDDGAELLLAG